MSIMDANRSLFIPVILGMPRQGRMSEYVARFVLEELSKRDAIETTLIDIRTFSFPTYTDAGEAIKDAQFSSTMMRADALVLGVPGVQPRLSRLTQARARYQPERIHP